MNISIFGLGHVGCISLGCLARAGHNVIGVDISETKVNQVNAGLPSVSEKDIDYIIREEHGKSRIAATKDYCKAILESDLSLVAVEVPIENTGHASLHRVYKLAETFGRILQSKQTWHVIAIRSDVPPGTADKFASIIEEYSGRKRDLDFAVVSNPHFLRKGTAVDDYYHPPLTIVGSTHREASELVASLYKNLPAELVHTDLKTAELMKFVNNSFHALKVSFANEIAGVCEALRLDATEVMAIFRKDKKLNLSEAYLEPGFAFGGSGLRKSLSGMRSMAHDHHVPTPVLDGIDKTNHQQIERAMELIRQSKKTKLGLLGLSFKSGAAEISHSSTVTLVEGLLGKGYEIAIYDKHLKAHKEQMEAQAPHIAKLMKEHISEVMNESEIIVVANFEEEYTDVLMNVEMEHPVIDLARLPATIRKRKNYQAIH